MNVLDQVLDIIVDDFHDKNELFTSVDVANKIKRCGYWIRTKDVAAHLRNWICSTSDYTQTQIDVKRQEDGAIVVANLYHPLSKQASDYQSDGYALTPDDFEDLNKPEKLPKALNPSAVKSTGIKNPDGDVQKAKSKKAKSKKVKEKVKEKEEDSKDVESSKDLESTKQESKTSKKSQGRDFSKFNFK